MGRELKRVSLDFEWEVGKVWTGYVNPHKIHECRECQGLGHSKEYNEYRDKWYSWNEVDWKPNPFRPNARYNAVSWSNNLTQDDVDALIEADRLWDFTRVPLNDEHREIVKKKIEEGGNSWLPFNNGYKPTPKEVNDWNLKTMGHDSINCNYIITARLLKEGKPYVCSKCDGTGENWQSERAKELYESWEKYEPPTGEGFQLWETTSEGSPKTPVFKTLEELCEYCEIAKVSVFGRETATKERWMMMLNDDFVYLQEDNLIFL
jgi:hypothetical protein